MSLISIAQKETFHISFVQFANQDYEADLLTPESYKQKNRRQGIISPVFGNGFLQNIGKIRLDRLREQCNATAKPSQAKPSQAKPSQAKPNCCLIV